MKEKRCHECNESKVVLMGDDELPIISYCRVIDSNIGANSFCKIEGVER